MKPTDYCYIGVKPDCGCIRYVTADEPEYAKDNAKEIARLIKQGYTVEHITVAEFKSGSRMFGCKNLLGCKHAKSAQCDLTLSKAT